MPKINKLSWGKIKIDSKDYKQVLIINGFVKDRDEITLKKLFNTTHRISKDEEDELLSNSPEIILIGDGWQGVLKVEDNFINSVKSRGITIEILHSRKAVKRFNQLTKEGKKVNALINTTC